MLTVLVIALIVTAGVCVPSLVHFVTRAETLIDADNIRALTHSTLEDPETIRAVRASALKVFPPEMIEKRFTDLSATIGKGMASGMHRMFSTLDGDDDAGGGDPSTEPPNPWAPGGRLTQRKRTEMELVDAGAPAAAAAATPRTRDGAPLTAEETAFICESIKTRKTAHALLKQKLGCG